MDDDRGPPAVVILPPLRRRKFKKVPIGASRTDLRLHACNMGIVRWLSCCCIGFEGWIRIVQKRRDAQWTILPFAFAIVVGLGLIVAAAWKFGDVALVLTVPILLVMYLTYAHCGFPFPFDAVDDPDNQLWTEDYIGSYEMPCDNCYYVQAGDDGKQMTRNAASFIYAFLATSLFGLIGTFMARGDMSLAGGSMAIAGYFVIFIALVHWFIRHQLPLIDPDAEGQ